MASIFGISTQSSLFAQNALQTSQTALSKTQMQLATGKKSPYAFFAPADVAISQSLRTQISGYQVASESLQNATGVTRTADQTLSSQGEILQQMRDLAVRASNTATLSPSDQANLDSAYQALKGELDTVGRSAEFNGQKLTTDVAGEQYGTRTVPAGPESGNTVSITINPSTTGPGGILTGLDSNLVANPGNAINEVDKAIENLSGERTKIGTTERNLQAASELTATNRVHISQAYSSIADTNYAQTISENVKNMLLNNVNLAMMSKGAAQSWGVLKAMGKA